MQVLAVGKWLTFSSLEMHSLGLRELNPKVGGREQDVTYKRKWPFCSALKSLSSSQKYTIVMLFSW